MIIRIVIGEREWAHRIAIIKQDRYGRSLGLGQISALRSGDSAFPGQQDCLCGLLRALPFESWSVWRKAFGKYKTGPGR